jgi:DNA-binding XRE family transcriptional regulator
MTKPQIIETPQGERMAVLPIAEYERLREAAEMLEDIAALDEVMRKVAAGEEEFIPEEYADRLIDGENPVRVWREYRGLKARELAEAAGISPPYLSQIENGEREGSFETMRKIADVLKVTIDDLV